MAEFPLISCVMPTANRPKFAWHAIDQFLAQTYPNRELIVVDDGEELREDAAGLNKNNVRIYRNRRDLTLGAKRNEINRLARGEFIMHWDDDDWFSMDRIMYQYEELTRAKAPVCGLRSMLFYDLLTDERWLYEYGLPGRWLAGGSLLYRREVWENNPFQDVSIGSDWGFSRGAAFENAVALRDINFYVATIHGGNTSARKTDHAFFKPYSGPIPQGVVDMADLVH